MSRMGRSFYIAVIIAGLSAIAQAQGPADWTQWRGPARDGVIASFTPPASWPDTLVKRWSVEIGTGYATPIVVGDRVYQFSRIGENETMTAFDAATGKQLWQGAYPAEFTLNNVAAAHGKGPKSTPTFFDNRLYSIGMTGTVTAWEAASGKPLWRKPGNPGNVPATTTHAFSPLVEGGSVIFHLGGDNDGALTAFDLVSGAEKWKWTGDGPGYGSPVMTEVAQQRAVVDLTSGRTLWTSEPRQGAKSALQRAGNLIFILEADGELVVARESKTAFDVVKRYKVADEETWSQPAISGNRIFVKDVSTLTLWTIN
jgi:hypothetical protein